MARPVKTGPKAKNVAVSMYPHHEAAFRALGGSKWLQNILDAEHRQMEQGKAALPHLVRSK